jgi:ubiquinone/menaquinone biosynthesis C-methylase UbiE
MTNIDTKTVEGFGREWSTFHRISNQENIFKDYFRIFPWHLTDKNSVGLDFGCGNGRWAAIVAPEVKRLYAVDASEDALWTAMFNVKAENVTYSRKLQNNNLDFAYSIGVLHHVPDTQRAINEIYAALKPGAPFLVYLYYAFDNKPRWYKWLWKVSDILRLAISRLPSSLQLIVSQAIACVIYWPLSRFGYWWPHLPLAYYADKSFYVMRTDSYDRFCTRLEKRFTKEQIRAMLEKAGFKDIKFSDRVPYWCAVAIK